MSITKKIDAFDEEILKRGEALSVMDMDSGNEFDALIVSTTLFSLSIVKVESGGGTAMQEVTLQDVISGKTKIRLQEPIEEAPEVV